ncbi:MAG: M28 family peptidase [Deltaproteobacteria bacterium]|nr:M28 family peptidase [Deltaproteobacteria bacterium]
MKTRRNLFIVLSLVILLSSGLSGWGNSTVSAEENQIERGKHVEPAEKILEMLHDLCDIAGYGIHSGIQTQPKADQAADYILKRLREQGVHAKLEPITANSPYPERFELIVEVDGQHSRTLTCFPLQWTVGTPEGGIKGKVVYVGDGSASHYELFDVEGKIALIDEKMMRGYSPTARANGAVITAKDKGAIGVIRAGMQVDSPQFQKGDPTMPPEIFPIPVFSVGKSVGDYLRDLATSATPPALKMVLDVPHQRFAAHNVVFELPGNGSMEEVILVGTHYDTGMFTGAVDNNGSVALMIAWAGYFTNKPRESRNRDMIFAWCFGHDFDNNTGHYQFAKAHKDQLEKAIVWDVDHAVGGLRYVFDEIEGKIVPTDKTNEFYIISNNYTFTRLAAFTMDKYGFVCTQNRFNAFASGPQWGIAPTTRPWVNVATIPIYYHSILDTPEKVTLDQVKRAYTAHIEILENIDRTPEGFLEYDNISQTRPNRPPKVRIEILSDKVRVGDRVLVWNDSYFFNDDKTSYHYPALPEWAGTTWDWGDGTPLTIGGPMVDHVYENPGTYSITMTFTDTEGAQGTSTREIKVLSR